jgi:hypothetical protein
MRTPLVAVAVTGFARDRRRRDVGLCRSLGQADRRVRHRRGRAPLGGRSPLVSGGRDGRRGQAGGCPVRTNAAAFGPLGTLLTHSAPISNDTVTIDFRQRIGPNEALRTGAYSKTLTFTLSTTRP